MTFYVEYEVEEVFSFDAEALGEKVASEVLEWEKCHYDAEVSLIITDNDNIQEINREQREIDRPTDVLSFPCIEFENPGDFSVIEGHELEYFNPESQKLMLGDIVISVDKVKEQAENYGHSEEREFAFLVAHSMLHLCGYDHMEKEEALIMEKKQEEILAHMGITRD